MPEDAIAKWQRVWLYDRATGEGISRWYLFATLEEAAEWCDNIMPPNPKDTRWEIVDELFNALVTPDRKWAWEV